MWAGPGSLAYSLSLIGTLRIDVAAYRLLSGLMVLDVIQRAAPNARLPPFSEKNMNKLQLCLCALALGSCATTPNGGPGAEDALVLGTFDSRGVAVAYVRSPAFAAVLQEMRADLERARAAGDEERVAQLEAEGPALQQVVHEQGFGTAPVDDILEHIADELPAIAQAAGVDVIVSRWQLAYRHPGARTVDVTDQLVAEFEPDEQTLQVIRELLESDPVLLSEITE